MFCAIFQSSFLRTYIKLYIKIMVHKVSQNFTSKLNYLTDLYKSIIYMIANSTLNYLGSIFVILLITCTMGKQLVMVQQTFRHGARFPLFAEKEDQSAQPQILENLGQLTTQGKNMHYLFGKIIYQKYWDQLFKGTPYLKKYSSKQILVISTDKNRTIESAQSHIYGLLEKLPKLQLNNSNYQFSLPAWKYFQASEPNTSVFSLFPDALGFHPTAIHVQKKGASSSQDEDFLTKFDIENCPNQKFWIFDNLDTDENMAIMRNPEVKQAITALSKEVGRPIEFDDVPKWTDTATCMKYLGYPQLQVFNNPQYQKTFDFIEVYSFYLTHFSHQTQISAIATTYFKKTLELFEAKQKQLQSPALIIYSAHDTTIGMLLSAMNLVNVKCIVDHYLHNLANDDTCLWQYPPYTANIIFQLWNNNGQFTVRCLYLGQPRKMPFCGMKVECQLSEFRNWVNGFVVNDVSKACGFMGNEKTYDAVIFLLSSALIFLVGYLIFLHAKIKKIDSLGRAKKQGYAINFQQKGSDRHEQQLK